MEEIDIYKLEDRAHKQGKAGFSAWLRAHRTGEDPVAIERKDNAEFELKLLAYSEYVRYNEIVPQNNVDAITEGEVMPDQPVTIEQIKGLFIEEREHTREMIREGVGEITQQFQSFIDNNFDPAMEEIDEKFEHIDDHLDRLDIEVVTLRTDVRQIKRYLRTASEPARPI